MKVIGHRGARGLAPENTIASIKRALAEGVDGIEFDIHVTSDGELILLHDDDFARTCGVDSQANQLTLSQIKKIRTNEGQPIPTLEQALDVIDNATIVIEGKGQGWAKPLAKKLKKHPKTDACVVISFDHDELEAFGKLSPQHKLYGLEQYHPLPAIRSARQRGFSGIDLNYKILNPLVFWWAKALRLDVVVYTVNRPSTALLITLACPGTAITTDFPNLMQRFRSKR